MVIHHITSQNETHQAVDNHSQTAQTNAIQSLHCRAIHLVPFAHRHRLHHQLQRLPFAHQRLPK